MRIFTKKAFKFRAGGNAVSTAALAFADVPEWVTKDPIFALAVKEGSIELIESKADEKLVEKTGTTKTEAEQEAGGAVSASGEPSDGTNTEIDETDGKKKAK